MVNDAYTVAPGAAALYACDTEWWKFHHQRVVQSGFAGELWTQSAEAAAQFGLNRVEHITRKGMSTAPGIIHGGGNSGYQALNLAILWGARRVILLGFDMCVRENGKAHFFGDHPSDLQRASPFGAFVAAFNEAAPHLRELGVDVVNASRDTALECFPRQPVEDAINAAIVLP